MMMHAIESSRGSDLQGRREERLHLLGPVPLPDRLDLEEAAEALVRQLGDEDPQRRQQAASSLRTTGSAALPALGAALADPRALAREWACRLLGGFGEAARDRAPALRVLATDDPVWAVRSAAAAALRSIRWRPCGP